MQFTVPLHVTVKVGAPKPEIANWPSPVKPATPRRESMMEAASEIPFLEDFSPSSLAAERFEYSTALSLALAARLAYEDESEVKSVVRNVWGMTDCEFVDLDDTQCFLARAQGVTLVAFRGTEALGDWLANLNVWTTTRPFGTVHRGFLGAFQVVQERLEALLDRAPGPVVLSGHSLGGALAVIAAAIWQGRYNIFWVHTCGQPAVGMAAFQEFLEIHYGDSYYRFVNDEDIVPRVPPFFKHAGRLIHFTADGDIESASKSGELEALGVDLAPGMEETPMLTKEQFDLLRARLLEESAAQGGAPLGEESVERAAEETLIHGSPEGVESLEGFLPSVSDHNMDTYVRKIARHAGVRDSDA